MIYILNHNIVRANHVYSRYKINDMNKKQFQAQINDYLDTIIDSTKTLPNNPVTRDLTIMYTTENVVKLLNEIKKQINKEFKYYN